MIVELRSLCGTTPRWYGSTIRKGPTSSDRDKGGPLVKTTDIVVEKKKNAEQDQAAQNIYILKIHK